MLKKIIKRYRRIIIAVAVVLLVGGITTGIIISNKGKNNEEQSGISINAGDDNKDNQADFNGKDEQQTTQPVVEEEKVDTSFDTVIEQKGSIVGEWTTSQGDTFNCLQSDDKSLYASVSLVNGNKYWCGAVDTDHTTYIKLTDDNTSSVIDIEIVEMANASDLGLSGSQVYLLLKFPGDDTETLFRRANEDYLHEEIKDVLEQEGDGISGGSPDDDQYLPEAEEIEIIEEEEETEPEDGEAPVEEPVEEPVE